MRSLGLVFHRARVWTHLAHPPVSTVRYGPDRVTYLAGQPGSECLYAAPGRPFVISLPAVCALDGSVLSCRPSTLIQCAMNNSCQSDAGSVRSAAAATAAITRAAAAQAAAGAATTSQRRLRSAAARERACRSHGHARLPGGTHPCRRRRVVPHLVRGSAFFVVTLSESGLPLQTPYSRTCSIDLPASLT